jgi:hypothetical protein
MNNAVRFKARASLNVMLPRIWGLKTVPKGLQRRSVAQNLGGIDIFRIIHYIHRCVTFLREPGQGTPKIRRLLFSHFRSNCAVCSRLETSQTSFQRKIQYDRNSRLAIFRSQPQKTPARFTLDAGGVDNSQPASAQPHYGDEPQQPERIRGGRLIRRVIRNRRPQRIRRHDFRALEVFAGEGGFSASCHTHQQHQCVRRNVQKHDCSIVVRT